MSPIENQVRQRPGRLEPGPPAQDGREALVTGETTQDQAQSLRQPCALDSSPDGTGATARSSAITDDGGFWPPRVARSGQSHTGLSDKARDVADTVLLFGGRSFLGGHICRALIRHGYRVLLHSTSPAADFRNLRDLQPNANIEPVVCGFDKPGQLRELMERSQFVIYAAIPYSKQSIGQSGKTRQDLRDLESTLSILAASNITKTVFVSVSGTIGRVSGGIADETRVAEDAPGGWGHLKLKVASEQLILQHARNGLRAVIVNPSMCVGEYDTKPSTGEFFKFFARFPFALMPNERLNIVDVEDVALGTVLALEKGQSGQRYILSGTNTTMGALIRRIKQLEGKPMPRLAIPRRAAILVAYFFELLNLVARRSAPVVPLLGVELIEQGSQHLSFGKAERELGFEPRDAWLAVDRSYQWYRENRML
jgi:dihydroflavonol-4-reductase